MKRTERQLLILVTILHVLAQVHLYFNFPVNLIPSDQKINRIAASLGVDARAYRESFRYTSRLYPFLPPDTVWLKRTQK